MMIVLCGWAFSMVLSASCGAMEQSNSTTARTGRSNSKLTKDIWEHGPLNDTVWKMLFKRNNASEDSNEIFDEFDPKIVNGRRANEGEFPWMVALHHDGRFICSSFLISPTLVMTAAHCVKFGDSVEPATSFYGIIGNVLREGPETRIEFREVAAHPRYGAGTSEYDIAVLRTSSPVERSDRVRTICIPTGDSELQINRIQAMGWGLTDTNAREAPETLMTTELRVMGQETCQAAYGLTGVSITERHLCVYSFKRTGICFGDSGGPAVLNDAGLNEPVAVGVASFITALGCGRVIIPSVYTRISSYVDWLTETVGSTNDICFV